MLDHIGGEITQVTFHGVKLDTGGLFSDDRYTVTWDKGTKTATFVGVCSWAVVEVLLKKLTSTASDTVDRQPGDDTLEQMWSSSTANRPPVSEAPPPVLLKTPLDADIRQRPLMKKSNPKEANSKEANSKEANSKEANSKEANSKEANSKEVLRSPREPLDVSVFSRMTQLREVVKELHRKGYTTFKDILEHVIELRDTELCPLLDRFVKLDDLEQRVQSACVASKIISVDDSVGS
jgi:hypothetical protein